MSSILLLIPSALLILLSITVESNCGNVGEECCDVCVDDDILHLRPRCFKVCSQGQGTCIGKSKCCPNKGDSCCDVFGASNCCNPTAPYCVDGICTDIAPSGDSCTENEDCCSNKPICFGNQCYFVKGRPYNILNTDYKDLHANIINNCDIDAYHHDHEYIHNALSEHASIGTFNKFCIELMNLGAPLWFVQLSQNAALDEINHTKIWLNILNENNTDSECVEIGKFPNHKIEFNGDCNAVSLDVVNGGCFGETISSINTMIESSKFEKLYSVAIDEVRHSALAWIASKWMINNCQYIDIQHKKWWNHKLEQYKSTPIIQKMFNQFWNFNGNDYQNLYKLIHDILYKEVLILHSSKIRTN